MIDRRKKLVHVGGVEGFRAGFRHRQQICLARQEARRPGRPVLDPHHDLPKLKGDLDLDARVILVIWIEGLIEYRSLQDAQPGLVERSAIFEVVLLDALPVFPAFVEFLLLRRAVAEMEGVRVGADGPLVVSPIDVLATSEMTAIKYGSVGGVEIFADSI